MHLCQFRWLVSNAHYYKANSAVAGISPVIRTSAVHANSAVTGNSADTGTSVVTRNSAAAGKSPRLLMAPPRPEVLRTVCWVVLRTLVSVLRTMVFFASKNLGWVLRTHVWVLRTSVCGSKNHAGVLRTLLRQNSKKPFFRVLRSRLPKF